MKKFIFAIIIFISFSSYAQDTIRIKLNGSGAISNLWAQSGDDIFNLTTGNVGIGTTDTKGYKFAVNGDALFTKIKVKLYNSWPDYVFDEKYPLLSLPQTEAFIKKYKHLPDLPSASEIEKNGLDLGKSESLLLKKIEELTLYSIEQDKLINEQAQKIKQMEERLQKLESTQ